MKIIVWINTPIGKIVNIIDTMKDSGGREYLDAEESYQSFIEKNSGFSILYQLDSNECNELIKTSYMTEGDCNIIKNQIEIERIAP